MLMHKLRRPFRRRADYFRMDTAAEVDAGLAGQIEGLHRSPNADKVKVGGAKEQIRCGWGNLPFHSPHAARTGDRPSSVANHQVFRLQLPELAIARLDFF